MDPTETLNTAFINIRGQTGLTLTKQMQIEEFIRQNSIDILHLQESNILEDTFIDCKLISSSYNIIVNNSQTNYGTASLIKNDFEVKNVAMDSEGRVIIFEVGGVTCGNMYLHSGTDGMSRGRRENYLAEVVPKLLINHKHLGYIGGDLNCISNKEDATHNPESKISPSMKRLVKTFNWTDSFRTLYPNDKVYSRYYNHERIGQGASRIDRCYHWGELKVQEAKYISLAFSDHLAHIVSYILPGIMSRIISPKSRPFFRTRPEVVVDSKFEESIQTSMVEWQEVKQQGVDVLIWWEKLVKPGIRKLAKERGYQMNKERRSHLNILLVRQAYLTRKLQQGNIFKLLELKQVQLQIEQWYSEECAKIAMQSRVDDIQQSEKIRIYHHEIHQKLIKKSSILKLDTETGILEGHQACSNYLSKTVSDLLLHPAVLDTAAQEALLSEVEPVFTDVDNEMICALPEKTEVKEVVFNSNQHAAPGTDGLTAYL
jgi:exonuclease III